MTLTPASSRQTIEQRVTKTLTSAQLLDLHNTPVQLLPAPGGRRYYVLRGSMMQFIPGGTPYNALTDTQGPLIGYGATLAAIVSAGFPLLPLSGSVGGNNWFDPLNFFAQVAAAYCWSNARNDFWDYTSWPAAQIENKPISFGLGFSQQLTTGNGTLRVDLYYMTMDGA